VDNLNDYYDVRLKESRLARLLGRPGFDFVKLDLANRAGMEALFQTNKFDRVVNLAAQVGVRYSLTNPHAYVNSNVVGFLNVLEGCRHGGVGHLLFASSSSVYGANTRLPFSEHDNVDHPVSLYAATKKSGELMAHTYAHLYRVPCTGLRLFTVYGPWGRPDMALFKFTQAIMEERPLDVYHYGYHKRDFTYIDDIVEGIVRLIDYIPEPDSVVGPCSQPGDQQRPLPALQHRQQSARSAAVSHSSAGGRDRPQSQNEPAAHPAGRRARHLRRRR